MTYLRPFDAFVQTDCKGSFPAIVRAKPKFSNNNNVLNLETEVSSSKESLTLSGVESTDELQLLVGKSIDINGENNHEVISPLALQEAGNMVCCRSSVWKEEISPNQTKISSVWWVMGSQVRVIVLRCNMLF